MPSEDPLIAGDNRASDWRAFREKLADEPSPELWRTAFTDYLSARLESRYFEPIKRLENDRKLSGEGFSIMVILCSLVEFLQSTEEGLTYVHGKEPGPDKFEYRSSQKVFKKFLQEQKPFSNVFTSSDLAHDFYASVRCGLMHEAQTKNGWRVRWALRRELFADTVGKIVYWNHFRDAVLEYLADYATRLPNDRGLQEAFIRKFDGLC